MRNSAPFAARMLVVVFVASLGLAGCESRAGSALLGGAGGASAGAGGYEYHLKRQRDRVQADRDAGRIQQSEYDIRMDQIKRDSLLR